MAGFGDMTESEDEQDGEDISSFDQLMEASRSASNELDEQNLNIGVFGRPKTGKTHFSMSSPDPIFFIDTESGTGPVEYKFSDDKDIRLMSLNQTSDDFVEDHIEAWKNFNEVVNHLVDNEDQFETVVVDSVTDIWEICRNFCKDDIFGLSPEEKMNQQWDWGEINSRYRNVIQKLLQADFNVIFTARASEEYAGAGNPTGNYKPKWQNKTGHWLEVIVQNKKKTGEDGKKELFSVVEDSRFDGEETIMGTEIEEMEWEDLMEVLKRTMEGDQ